jgi:hypothetical protein
VDRIGCSVVDGRRAGGGRNEEPTDADGAAAVGLLNWNVTLLADGISENDERF